MTSNLKSSSKQAGKINWIWIVACAGAGCAAIGWGWSIIQSDENALSGFWSGVLVNVGTSILLAGVLFWLERRFVKEAGKVAIAAATNAVTQTAAARNEANERLSARISDLEERLTRQRAEQEKADVETIASLSEDASHDSVFSALRTAYEIGAITGKGLTVPTGLEPTAPRVTFRFRPGWRNEEGGGQDEGLDVEYVVQASRNRIGAPLVIVSWDRNEDPAQIFHELMEEMVRAGFGAETRRMKIEPAFRHLQRALRDAVSARRGEESAWQSGDPFLEFVTEGWVITKSGVEVQGHGIVAQAANFDNQGASGPRPLPSWDAPKKPDWAEAQIWEVAMDRARDQLRSWDPWS
ncbi:hypothetical protein [Arthrobacter crystallopoietes]|uniref:Uncharacterized protein n=1 Tax=Crystallibacter crystallopoietes TaxID=37928 RepID=A0A1H1CTP3_9MICC|nr:hypothetical protein [Arthrobacter crystallopoietes]SDQ67532.1 hypothetical protein SAMN04489742_2082 [Arthrobacter crystallopoietes]